MIKFAIIFSIIGAVIYVGASVVESVMKKKNTKDEEE